MNKWVHFIGIAGITTSGLAKAYLDKNYEVTGSEKGYFPPVSDYLLKNGIKILPGFKKERLYNNGRHPDLVIVQSSKGINNEELSEALKLGLQVKAYPEVLKEECVVKESIVVAGSFAKTTITALLVNIFKDKRISFMYGGFDKDLNDNLKLRTDDSEYSIIEGDEYLTSFKDKTSKFFHYSPKYLILTGLKWDHHDLFPTFEEYIDAFKKLINTLPDDGLIIANGDDELLVDIISKQTKIRTILCYSSIKTSPEPSWYLIEDSKPLKVMVRQEQDKDMVMIPYERNFLGIYNDKNILLASALSFELGLPVNTIQEGIRTFKGIKRRLEIIDKNKDSYIISDFGSTPGKAKTSINAVLEEFPLNKVNVVIDPSSGNRGMEALNEFKDVFPSNVHVFIPQFTLLPKSNESKFNEQDFSNMLNALDIENIVLTSDEEMINKLKEIYQEPKNVILFLGSHSFRNMIQRLKQSIDGEKTV